MGSFEAFEAGGGINVLEKVHHVDGHGNNEIILYSASVLVVIPLAELVVPSAAACPRKSIQQRVQSTMPVRTAVEHIKQRDLWRAFARGDRTQSSFVFDGETQEVADGRICRERGMESGGAHLRSGSRQHP